MTESLLLLVLHKFGLATVSVLGIQDQKLVKQIYFHKHRFRTFDVYKQLALPKFLTTKLCVPDQLMKNLDNTGHHILMIAQMITTVWLCSLLFLGNN